MEFDAISVMKSWYIAVRKTQIITKLRSEFRAIITGLRMRVYDSVDHCWTEAYITVLVTMLNIDITLLCDQVIK